MMGFRVNVHVTISGVVGTAEELEPVALAISEALDKSCGDVMVTYSLFATTKKQLEKKRHVLEKD